MKVAPTEASRFLFPMTNVLSEKTTEMRRESRPDGSLVESECLTVVSPIAMTSRHSWMDHFFKLRRPFPASLSSYHFRSSFAAVPHHHRVLTAD